MQSVERYENLHDDNSEAVLTTNSAPKHVLGKNCNDSLLMSDRLSMDVQWISIDVQFMFHWVLCGFPMDSRWGVDRFDSQLVFNGQSVDSRKITDGISMFHWMFIE